MSAAAAAVQEQIKQRIDAMDEADRAAFEETLAAYFPTETVEVDGVEYVWFTIELEVRDGDTVRVERYGFRQDEDGQWIFAKLEVAA